MIIIMMMIFYQTDFFGALHTARVLRVQSADADLTD